VTAIRNAPTGPTNATASIRQTNAAEIRSVPSQRDAASMLARQHSASTSTSGASSGSCGARITTGTAPPSSASSTASAARRCVVMGTTVTGKP
jgi:hypothetical protein